MSWRVSVAALLCLACEPGERVAGSPALASGPNLLARTDAEPLVGSSGPDSTGDDVGEGESTASDTTGGPALDEPVAEEETEDTDDTDGDDTDDDTGRAWTVHEVVPAESLAQLALRYRVDPGKLRAWNGLGRRAKIRPGQRLRLLARRTPPPRERVVHVVREGDTWTSIARIHGCDPGDLRAYNIKRTGRRLYSGLELEVWRDPPLGDLRWTVDTPEDYAFASCAATAAGSSPNSTLCTWSGMASMMMSASLSTLRMCSDDGFASANSSHASA